MKLDSLKTKLEFDFVYKNAKKFFYKHFILYALRISHHQPPHFRDKKILQSIQSRKAAIYLGFSISRKIGKANKRNLLTRRIKAIVYENSAHYEGLIFIFVAKDGATSLAFPMLKRDVLSAFTRAYDMLCFPSQKSSLKKRYECY